MAPMDLNLTDPQTAFGVALRLDAWETLHDKALDLDLDKAPGWADSIASGAPHPACSWVADNLEGMAARITEIGLDARIRRALWPDDEVEPGTLATLRSWVGWEISYGDHRKHFSAAEYGAWWANSSDPMEALKAIDAAMTEDRATP